MTNNVELSPNGASALRYVQSGTMQAVVDQPGWYWPCPPCGPGELRELERLGLATLQTLPYSGGRAEGEVIQRLALSLTNSGRKLKLRSVEERSVEEED